MRYLHPQPDPAAVPATMPSPFDVDAVHPLARRAAEELLAELRAGGAPDEGKMVGVLVVRAPDGRVGVLRGFSGMLAGAWDVEGFVPPAYDAAVKAAVWPAGEVELALLEARRAELLDGPDAAPRRAELAAITARHTAALADLRARHKATQLGRAAQRAAIAQDRLADPDESRAAARNAAIDALANESRADTAEEKRLLAQHAEERARPGALVAALDTERALLDARRAARSRELLHAIYDSYVLASARGERRPLRDIFAPAEPPGGAGDCAAPKLLAHAYRIGATPLALAEVWWGPPPPTGGRRDGTFYPACRGKCGPILAHMLDGLGADAAPEYGSDAIAASEPRTVFEDAHLVVVEKPVGLLSVPGRSGRLRDSVQTRLRARYPDATGPLVVHRLDLDTSGLLLAAKDAATHTGLQAMFARREIAKRYVAILDGAVAADTGSIELPLRVDLDDRPRQIIDPVHGKPALTDFTVLARTATTTRVALVPHTGRTHQLRVHCADARGLAAPILGDRLYGSRAAAARLLLHAESLAFTHPHTGARMTFVSPPPF